jgi:plastocyanin
VVGALALAAVTGGAALAADHAVAISGFAYSPSSITVTVGDTVTWTNSDAQAHTATADGGGFDTGALGNGQSGTVTFSTAGSFAYHCSIHPDMTGTVTVQAAASGGGGNAGTTTQPPTDTAPVEADGAASPAAAIALVLAGAGVAGFVVARRRFARA